MITFLTRVLRLLLELVVERQLEIHLQLVLIQDQKLKLITRLVIKRLMFVKVQLERLAS